MRAPALAVLLFGGAALAEAPWFAVQGRPETLRLGVQLGTRSLTAGLLVPDAPKARGSLTAELAWGFLDRTVELRGARVWQLTPIQGGTALAFVGGSATLVPEGRLDVGLGPQVGVALSAGVRAFTVDLSALVGAELFPGALTLRLTPRLGFGLSTALGPVQVSLAIRGGLDFALQAAPVGRGEAAVSVSWLREPARPKAN